MQPLDVLYQILIAGLLGITGQMLRIIVGLKKLNDEANAENIKMQDLIITSKIVISILIGFVSGILAWLAVSEWKPDMAYDKNTILGFLAAGYSGTDFIEGFISKYLPKNKQPANS